MFENNNQYPNDTNYNAGNYQSPYTGDVVETGYSNYQYQTNPEPEKKKTNKSGKGKKVLTLAGSGIVFGAFAGAIMASVLYLSPQKEGTAGKETAAGLENSFDTSNYMIVGNEETETERIETSNVIQNATTVTDVSDVVAEVMPSVVSITGMYKVENQYNEFFGGYFGYEEESEEPGSGSGIIVGENDTELLLVTNYHVVENATSLSVQFIDGETVDAKVKGTDSSVDLAVIAVALEDIKPETSEQIRIANLGDSNTLRVGEAAIAIGNALGYGQSVTTGVISAVNREYTIDNTTNYLIQTDAAINPGNSGGALLNVRGEVVGINSNKIAGSVVEGMGYAIPISTAKPIIENLMTKETRDKVEEDQKAFLGISGINVTEDVQANYGLPEGIYIAQVHENTAAANAGLTKGDILVQFDGEKVNTIEALTELLEYYKKGTTVEVVIMQGSPEGYKEKTITVTLGGRTDS